MRTLITYKPAFGTAAASPFCIKAIWLLNMSGQPWQRQDLNDPRKMPKQKLPVLRDGPNLIPDSANIRHYLEAQGADFDAGLSDVQKANARAFVQMAEEHLYFHIVQDRWGDDKVWPIVRDTYFDAIPKPLRKFITNRIRKNVLQGLQFQGVGRFTPQERLERVAQDFHAIAARLWQGPYLFGDRPTSADISVGAMLTTIRATPGQTLLKTRLCEDEMLCRYIDRVEQACGAPRLSDVSARLSA